MSKVFNYDLTTNVLLEVNTPNETLIRKKLIFPNVIEELYSITSDGLIYNRVTNNRLGIIIRNYFPVVNLSCRDNGRIITEPFKIKDLMAFNFIANAKSYLAKGYKVINIDGDNKNNHYTNIRYIKS